MTTSVATVAKELAALKRVEKAARRVIRYPSDVAPRRSLGAAIKHLDRVREGS
jgi:hypothetical protein